MSALDAHDKGILLRIPAEDLLFLPRWAAIRISLKPLAGNQREFAITALLDFHAVEIRLGELADYVSVFAPKQKNVIPRAAARQMIGIDDDESNGLVGRGSEGLVHRDGMLPVAPIRNPLV